MPETIIRSIICLAPFTVAELASNSDFIMTARCFDISMGNMCEDNFKEIWLGEKYKEFRNGTKEAELGLACTR
jgi:hypothetical protein